MDELAQILKLVQDKWGRETVNAIVRKIDSYPIRWNGTLRRSISYSQAQGIDGEIEFNMADYGKFVDEGVNGIFQNRNSPYSFRISSIGGVAFHIKPWASSKGINNWAAARSIARDGIKPRPFFNSVIESRTPQLGEAITKAMADFMETTFKQQ
jgi:hypothetical protein